MKLIDGGFRAWWKKYSALFLFGIALFNGAGVAAWAASPEFQEFVKSTPWAAAAGAAVSGVLAVAGFVGRFIKQADDLINAIPEEPK